MNALMSDFHAICDFGGRFAGSDGEAAACEWLEARLRRVTGEAPRRVPVDYQGWSRGEAVLERLDGSGGTYDCISLVRSPPTSADGLEADLIDVGRGTEAEFDAAGHYNFARAGVPATRLVAGFNQPESNLRYVLTPADTRDKVRASELAGAVWLTARLVEDACRTPALELR